MRSVGETPRRRSWLDRALGAVGLTRAQPAALDPRRAPARSRVFHAATVDRLTVDLLAANLSANDEIKADLYRLRGLSRRLSRDTALGRRFPRLVSEQTIGADGIKLQARVEKRLGGRNLGLNKRLEDAWKAWGAPEYCTVEGGLSWTDVQTQAVELMAKDGEFLARHVRGAENPFGYALEILDADLLDETYNGTTPNGNRVITGVEVNRYGRAVAYWLWSAHPSEVGVRRERTRVPAADIVHLFLVERSKQIRGIPWSSAILLDANTLGAFLEASVHAARIGASRMAAIERDKDFPGDDDELESMGSNIPDEVSPGQMLDLAPGERLASIDWQYPTGEIDPFVKIVDRHLAAGWNVSYASLTGDLSNANYSSMRYGLLFERDGYRRLQRMLIERLCWPVYRVWRDFAILSGKLPARSNLEDYDAVRWMPRGYPWIDPAKDMEAQTTALDRGLTTRRRILGEQGDDLEDVLEELAEEEALIASLGVSVQVGPPTAAPKAATTAAPTESPTGGDGTASDPQPGTGEKPVRRIA